MWKSRPHGINSTKKDTSEEAEDCNARESETLNGNAKDSEEVEETASYENENDDENENRYFNLDG